MAHDFINALETKQSDFFKTQASNYLSQNHPKHIMNYINHRLVYFKKVFNQIDSSYKSEEPFLIICLVLWNLELFFEYHEWLEKKWLHSKGNKKKAYQALILAAVTYEQLEYGRIAQARTLGLKAAALLDQYRKQIPLCFDPDTLIKALTHLLSAPKFNLDQI